MIRKWKADPSGMILNQTDDSFVLLAGQYSKAYEIARMHNEAIDDAGFVAIGKCADCKSWNTTKTRPGWGKCFELSIEAADGVGKRDANLDEVLYNESSREPTFWMTPHSFGCNNWRAA